ncbi:MAG: hypothetical protein ORN28_11995 [Rhodoferax sp.]|nr:hypothetical protein [Rhodoferax sp.]
MRNRVRIRSTIDQNPDADSRSYVKQSLVFMLGRKRKNDWVRKLEFDQLRKLQYRTPNAPGQRLASAPPQTWLPTDSAAIENQRQTWTLYRPALQRQNYLPPPFACNTHVPQISLWVCPAQLRAADVQQLHSHLLAATLPRVLNWARLVEITVDAQAPLNAWLEALCSQTVHVRFVGTQVLLQTVRTLTPTDGFAGKCSTERSCWALHLNLLRALGLQDAYDLVALDYCIAYEEAPAGWQDASCQIEQGVRSEE